MNLQVPQTNAAIHDALSGLVDLDGEPIEGEVGSELEKALETRTCQQCGKRFQPTEWQRTRGAGHFCTQACSGRAGGLRGRGEAKSRSEQNRAYQAAKREGRWMA